MGIQVATATRENINPVTHEGLVLNVRDLDDSLWERSITIADVWNPETRKVEAVTVGGGYWGETHNGTAVPDASDAVREQAFYAEFVRIFQLEIDAAALAEVREAQRVTYRLNAIQKGCTAKIIKGRKVPLGTEGTVIWTGTGAYGERVGLKDAAGTVHWTAASNVERTGATAEAWDFLPAWTEVERTAYSLAVARTAAKVGFRPALSVAV